MNTLQNLHTHTIYCDGKDTPEQMIQYALEKGFGSLGFSGHAHMPYYSDCSFTAEKTEMYKKEVLRLKEKYKGEISIFLGMEMDLHSQADITGFDYLIGSVHGFPADGEYAEFDRSAQHVKKLIDRYFAGDGMMLAQKYYEELTKLPQRGDFDIIGHFDLVTKNIEILPFLDENSKPYLDMAYEAMHALKGKIPFFEVNTGAIARGYRTTPYPSIPLIKEFKRQGFGVVITSDCHDGSKLDCGFADARQILMECGFEERYILTSSGFQAVAI